MELHQIRYFLATCQTRNFTRAAKLCNVSQPALTKAVKLLESELGGDLIDRQSRPLQLTPLGQQLFDKFRTTHSLVQEIREDARRFRAHDRRDYTLGMVNSLPSDMFFSFVESLQRGAPDLALSIHSIAQHELIERLTENRLELAVLDEPPEEDESFSCTRLWKHHFAVTVAPTHHLADRKELTLEDLVDEEMILRAHCPLSRRIGEQLDQMASRGISRIATDQNDMVVHLVKAGLGFAVLPDCLISEPLVRIELLGEQVSNHVCLAEKKGGRLSPSAARLKEVVIKQYRQTS